MMVETVFPYPVPVPERPLTASRVMGIGTGLVLSGKAFSYVFEPELSEGLGWVGGKVAEHIPKVVKEPVRRATGAIGYQFRSHAPEPLLKLVYGKEMGSAITIEREWSWAKPVAEGTAGMLEQAYGMPFYRQQTLWMEMPVKEWARVRQVEYLAPRIHVESIFGWEASAMGMKAGELVFTKVPHKEALETAETLHMSMPVEPKAEQWYTRYSGFERTPMKVTLQRAMEQKQFGELAKGGISASQELVLFPKETDIFMPSPLSKELTRTPVETFYMGFEPIRMSERHGLGLLTLGLGVTAMKKLFPYEMPLAKTTEMLGTGQISESATVTSLAQEQELLTGQLLKQEQISMQVQEVMMDVPYKQVAKLVTRGTGMMPPKMVPSSFFDFGPPRLFKKPSRKKLETGLYLWEFPIADPSKVLGLGKQGRKKRK
jgi:hypothetical protein